MANMEITIWFGRKASNDLFYPTGGKISINNMLYKINWFFIVSHSVCKDRPRKRASIAAACFWINKKPKIGGFLLLQVTTFDNISKD
jgi:hypothetical protein